MPTALQSAQNWLTESGVRLPPIPVIQPAEPFLDSIGEVLRRSIFLSENNHGDMLCFRPEFTIPVCRHHIHHEPDMPQRYGYAGLVFRQGDGLSEAGARERLQAGIEDLGDENRASADARILANAYAMTRHLLPEADIKITLGDQAVFTALAKALNLPLGWQVKLNRAFGHSATLARVLEGESTPVADSHLPDHIAEALSQGDEAALESAINHLMNDHGLSNAKGRNAGEITRRLMEKNALKLTALTNTQKTILRAFLALECTLDKAPAILRSFAQEHQMEIEAAIALFEARAEAMAKKRLPVTAIHYRAAFGRPLDYYTGLVFEMQAKGADAPITVGGRYDRLLRVLGAEQEIAGVGFSTWLGEGA